MSKDKIWLSSPHMGGNELGYIHDAFKENWIAPLGPNVDGFEKDLSSYIGVNHAAVLSSGTAAIHLALILLNVRPGDEVLCQSFTFAASANPIKYVGARPVFIDSEAETWNMDSGLLEEAIQDRIKIGQKPKAIMVVHLYGMPAQMEQIMTIAEKYDIPVIEDAAEALGSRIDKTKCGSIGKVGVLSFNGNKIITTSGGGALLSNNKDLIEKARFLATQARDKAPHYQHSQLGYNYRMSNISAGIGRGQMKVLEKHILKRRQVHQFYFEQLGSTWLQVKAPDSKPEIQNSSPTGIYFLKEPPRSFSNRWLTTIIVNPEETGGISREDIRLALEAQNVESRPLWKPMHLQPLYKNVSFYGNSMSEFLFKKGLCLPSGSNLKKEDLLRITENIKLTISL